MKKSLLLVAALAAGMTVNAQEYAYFQATLGLTDDTETLAAGTECGSTSIATAYIGAEDTYSAKSVNGPKASDGETSFKKVTFGGSVSMCENDMTDAGYDQGGIQGGTNPKDADGGTPSSTFVKPASGAYFEFTASGDGYLYVVAKISYNKAYTVFEEGSCLAYEIAAVADYETGAYYDFYDLGDEYGYLDLADFTIDNGDGTTTEGIQTINNYLPELIENGVGYIGFPIYADMTYQVCANGSKLTALGFVTSTDEITDIVASTADGSESVVLKGSDTGISNVKVSTDESDEDAPIYNLAGQRVTKDYKGVLIQNGKKFMNK